MRSLGTEAFVFDDACGLVVGPKQADKVALQTVRAVLEVPNLTSLETILLTSLLRSGQGTMTMPMHMGCENVLGMCTDCMSVHMRG